MTADADGRPKGGIKGDTTRAERLAAELRRNLVRRKDRARAAATTGRKAADIAGERPRSDAAGVTSLPQDGQQRSGFHPECGHPDGHEDSIE